MITQPVLIDTSPLVALLYAKDEHHTRCVEQSKELPSALHTCWPVITEAAYLLRHRPAAVEALLLEVE